MPEQPQRRRNASGQRVTRQSAGTPTRRRPQQTQRTTVNRSTQQTHRAPANEAAQQNRRQRVQSEDELPRTPSWYHAEEARHATRKPRAALDTSQKRTSWYSHGERDVYVGNRRPLRLARFRTPLIIVACLLVLVVLACALSALLNSCSATPDQSEDSPAATDTAAQTTSLTISFCGDCTLGTDENFSYSTSFNAIYEDVGDPAYFFENVASIFNEDDLSVANMEGTLTEATARQDKTYAFKGPAEYAQVLVEGGIETASLANNHSHDYGDESYTDTIANLEAAGLGVFGYDRIDYREVNGVKVALIGTYELADGIACQDELKQNIQTAKDNGAQITCVYFHWGTERETVPDETQVELGHIAIDAGADVVVGSHPHVIQGYEKYNGRYIVYSLGNFCFGGNSNPSDTDCMIFQQTFTVTGNDVATDDAINVIPCSITSSTSSNNYQPTPATGSEAERINEKIQESCEAITEISAQVSAQSGSSDAEEEEA